MKSTAIAVSLPRLPSRSRLTARLTDFVSLMKRLKAQFNNPSKAQLACALGIGADQSADANGGRSSLGSPEGRLDRIRWR